jgi:DNA-binding response OmpR family regulator
MRVLLIDDEVSLVRALAQILRQQQYAVDCAYDGVEGLDMARAGIYDLLLVDVMLPGLAGTDLVRTLREESDTTPILMLTARGTEEDKVLGLDSGADDYLVKPFGTSELLARMRALSRRVGDLAGVRELIAGAYTLDLVQRVVVSGGEGIPLTHKEFQLMELFMRHRGQVLSRSVIFDRVWGYDTAVDSNVVDTYIHFLRRKLQRAQALAAGAGSDIQTIHGTGYMFQPAEAAPRQSL